MQDPIQSFDSIIPNSQSTWRVIVPRFSFNVCIATFSPSRLSHSSPSRKKNKTDDSLDLETKRIAKSV